MRVLEVRNVHRALPLGVQLLREHGIQRDSRNGPVLQAPWPVTTVYTNPLERVLYWPQRDANPFFHLYESLWMLAGRQDVKPLLRYAKNMANFSDDGIVLHGAYGHRWRNAFKDDQLTVIAETLKRNPEDRRCVLQMWHSNFDLGWGGKDVPCNTTATMQRDSEGRLDLTVFCRSNDAIWGAYGANAVHMGYLLEYMAAWIGCPVGVYRQISVNFHAYLDTIVDIPDVPACPYEQTLVHPVRLFHGGDIQLLDAQIQELLAHADLGFAFPRLNNDDEPFGDMAYAMLRAHYIWSTKVEPERYIKSLGVLNMADQTSDWIVAGKQWIERRQAKWVAKMVR